MAEDCIFCRIVAGTAPASIIAETPAALAFMDIDQPTPGHVLIIPRAHVEYIYGLTDELAAEVFALTLQVAKAVKVALAPDGMDLFQANEGAGQQEVFHLHFHVIARYTGDRDRIRFSWKHTLPPRAELDRMAADIRTAL